MAEHMSKELSLLWIDKGFKLNGRWAVRKTYDKHYPAYMDNNGVEHAPQTRTFATDITFNTNEKTFSITRGAMIEGVFIPIKEDEFKISIETLRLICKTVKELGWT